MCSFSLIKNKTGLSSKHFLLCYAIQFVTSGVSGNTGMMTHIQHYILLFEETAGGEGGKTQNISTKYPEIVPQGALSAQYVIF